MTHTSGPSKSKTINSTLCHQCPYVVQFKIIIVLITTFHSVRVTNKPQSVSNAAYNFPGTHCSYSATGIRNWVTQQTWLDCFFGFVSLAVQRLPNFLLPHFTEWRMCHCHHVSRRRCSDNSKLSIKLPLFVVGQVTVNKDYCVTLKLKKKLLHHGSRHFEWCSSTPPKGVARLTAAYC